MPAYNPARWHYTDKWYAIEKFKP